MLIHKAVRVDSDEMARMKLWLLKDGLNFSLWVRLQMKKYLEEKEGENASKDPR